MRSNTLRSLIPLLALALFVTALMTPAQAAGPADASTASVAPAAPAEATGATDPFTAAATPGAHHKTLAALAGSYDLVSTFWPAPGAPPEVSSLPARRELILGGRALRLEVGPDANGFRGTGLMGYDNVAGEFWYAWTDTTTTGVSNMTGTLDAQGAGAFQGLTPTPFGAASLRVEIRIEGGEEIHDYFAAGEGGDEFRMLELRYRRSATAAAR